MEGVARGKKAELFPNPALHIFQFRHEELDGISTDRANHMVMRSAVQAVLVSRDPVVKVDFEGEAALNKKLKCAVHRRVADAGIVLSNKPMQLLDAQMIARGEEHIENALAFSALLEALFAKMTGKKTQSLCGQICAIRMHVVDPFFRCRAQ